MTEAQWLACENPKPMLAFDAVKWTDRKVRLFVCGCARRTDWLMRLAGAAATVEAAEQWADGNGTADVWSLAGSMIAGADEGHPHRQHFSNGNVFFGLTSPDARVAVGYTLAWFCGQGEHGPSGAGGKVACDVLRDLAGNPFRLVAFSPEWRTDTVLALAKQMYESRDFSAMPILADALQDAGCECDDVLDHCRGPGPHVRGCWVVDFVLGKE